MTVLTLAGTGHLSRLLPLIETSHLEAGIPSSDSRRRQAVEPLLRGTPLGAVWMIGPRTAPDGFLAAGFAWSMAAGGVIAQLDDFWIRPERRRQGIGGKALDELAIEVQRRGGVAVLMVTPPEAGGGSGFLARHGFFQREGARLAVRRI